MPKYCTSCGVELEKGVKFCLNCGTKAEETPASPKQPQPQQPSITQQPPLQPQPQQPMPILTPQKSKTKLIAVITIIVVAVIVIAVLFFAVFQNNTATTDTSSFVGSWNVEYLVGSSNPNLVWTFNQDGTLKSEQGNDVIWSDYEISGGRLCISSNEYSYYHCYDYELTDGGNSLTLSARGTTSIILGRIV